MSFTPPVPPPAAVRGLDWLPGLAAIDTGGARLVAAGLTPVAPCPAGRSIRLSQAAQSSATLDSAGLALAVAPHDHAFALALISAFTAAPGRPAAAAADSHALLALAARVASSDVTVLVEGATGTGKEGLARLVHTLSPRRDCPLVAVNCAALPEAMLEATLFGHERGAFTGAMAAGAGLFRAADGGTLLLDEVSELPLALQAKLLRAVQEREILPIGATKPRKIDVRIVACANRDLATEVDAGRFRADLYYRLAVFPLRLTPLAARPEDVPAIAATWLLRAAARNGGAVAWPTPEVLATLAGHDWPGNVRELGNVLDRALVLGDSCRIGIEHLAFDRAVFGHLAPAIAAPLPGIVRQHEDCAIRNALAETHGRRAAAQRLGISERTLRYKLAAMAGRRAPETTRTVQ